MAAVSADAEAVLARRALAGYGLEVEALTAVASTNNAVFRAHTGDGDYAVRVHRPRYRTPDHTRSELAYVQALVDRGDVEAPTPVPTRSGDLVAVVDDRHCSVTTWWHGEARRPGSGAGPATVARLGRALGHIHRFSESFAPPPGFTLPTWDLEAMFPGAGLDRLDDDRHRSMFAEVHDRARVAFEAVGRSSRTYGVVHHDFILMNCLHRGRRTAVIDFDDCGWGHYLQDLGGILGNLADYPRRRSLWGGFLDGYRSVRALPSEDDGDLEVMVALRHCWVTMWLMTAHDDGRIDADRMRQVYDYRIGEIEASLRRLG